MKNLSKTIIKLTLMVTSLLLSASCSGQNKSDSNAPDIDIHTAIISDNLEVLQQHIDFGSDLNVKDPFGGSSPLISAAVFGKVEAAKILLDAGVELHIQNNDGSTALHTAAFFCRPEIVTLLLDHGADKTITNNFGQTPLDTVSGSYAEVDGVYKGIGAMLEPMGLKLDLEYIEITRPQIALLLNEY